MRGWIQLCSDVNWIDYHGMWAKKASDGSWYVLRWNNLVDSGGSEFADTPFECSVYRLDLAELPAKERESALKSCGLVETSEGLMVDWSFDLIEPNRSEVMIVECCIQYGLGAPLETFTGSKHATRIRANARRYAETCMKDTALLQERLDRPVNAIGSTAAEYGRGDVMTALYEDRPTQEPMTIGLLRKLHGF
jgi:hypothetical protein